MVSKASDDLPEPLTPVTMISFPTGSVRSMFLRLCVRAPRMTRSAASAAGVSTVRFPGESLNHHPSARRHARQPRGLGAGATEFREQRVQLSRFVDGQGAKQFALGLLLDGAAARVRHATCVGEHSQTGAAIVRIRRAADEPVA